MQKSVFTLYELFDLYELPFFVRKPKWQQRFTVQIVECSWPKVKAIAYVDGECIGKEYYYDLKDEFVLEEFHVPKLKPKAGYVDLRATYHQVDSRNRYNEKPYGFTHPK